jgi:hypothetical protein
MSSKVIDILGLFQRFNNIHSVIAVLQALGIVGLDEAFGLIEYITSGNTDIRDIKIAGVAYRIFGLSRSGRNPGVIYCHEETDGRVYDGTTFMTIDEFKAWVETRLSGANPENASPENE